ncbi:MAG: hypothetical protein JNM13_13365 [Hyphomicrobiaceae bacterium]|nr:hypothetical protein [Hyphomicrobiaceae bacterium]
MKRLAGWLIGGMLISQVVPATAGDAKNAASAGLVRHVARIAEINLPIDVKLRVTKPDGKFFDKVQVGTGLAEGDRLEMIDHCQAGVRIDTVTGRVDLSDHSGCRFVASGEGRPLKAIPGLLALISDLFNFYADGSSQSATVVTSSRGEDGGMLEWPQSLATPAVQAIPAGLDMLYVPVRNGTSDYQYTLKIPELGLAIEARQRASAARLRLPPIPRPNRQGVLTVTDATGRRIERPIDFVSPAALPTPLEDLSVDELIGLPRAAYAAWLMRNPDARWRLFALTLLAKARVEGAREADALIDRFIETSP